MTIGSPKRTSPKSVHEVDGSPYKGDECSPKWTDIKHVHKMDRPSHEDDDWKSKMDESKISPQSGRITNSVKKLSTKWTDHLNGGIIYILHKMDGLPKR